MPYLPISDGRGHLILEAVPVIVGTLYFPNDARREQFATAMFARGLAAGFHDSETAVVSEKILSTLHRQMDLYGKHIAGELVIRFTQLLLKQPQVASLRRARAWLESEWVNRRSSTGRSVPVSTPYIKRAWRDFKPVAHLAAADRVDRLRASAGLPSITTRIEDEATILQFLSDAEFFAVVASKIRPVIGRVGRGATARADAPLIDPKILWRVPRDLELPPVRLPLPEFDKDAERRVRDYLVE